MKLSTTQDYNQANEIAARIFLADPIRYAGIQVEWAKIWREWYPMVEKGKA